MKRATLPLLIFAVFSIVSRAEAQDAFRRFKEGEWDNRLTAGYFTSSANYVSSGQSSTLLNGGKFQLTTVDLVSRYTILREWAVSAGLSGASAQSDGSLYGGRNASGLSDGRVGTEYRFALGSVDLIPEVSFLFPFQTNNPDQNAVMFNEGVAQTLGNLFVQADFQAVRLFGSAGYLYRGGGRSSLAPWSVGAELPMSRSTLGVKVFGYESVGNDADKGNAVSEATRALTSDRVNAGSLRFYSINPAIIDSDAYLQFELARGFRVGFSGGATLTGANQAQGYHGELTLAFRFVPRAMSSPGIHSGERRRSLDPSRERFSEDTEDGVDQRLFQPPAPPRQAPPLIVPPRPRRTVVPPSASRRRVVIPPSSAEQAPAEQPADPSSYDVSPTVTPEPDPQPQQNFPDETQREEEKEQQRVQKELNDAEMQIELKVDKKRRGR